MALLRLSIILAIYFVITNGSCYPCICDNHYYMDCDDLHLITLPHFANYIKYVTAQSNAISIIPNQNNTHLDTIDLQHQIHGMCVEFNVGPHKVQVLGLCPHASHDYVNHQTNVWKYIFIVLGIMIFLVIIVTMITMRLIGRQSRLHWLNQHDRCSQCTEEIELEKLSPTETSAISTSLSTINTFIDIDDPEITFRKNQWDEDFMDDDCSKYISLKILKLFL